MTNHIGCRLHFRGTLQTKARCTGTLLIVNGEKYCQIFQRSIMTKNIKYIQLLFSLLKKKNVYGDYIMYYHHSASSEHNGKNLFKFLNETSKYDWLTLAFSWYYTRQGFDFWHQMQTKWESIIRTTLI